MVSRIRAEKEVMVIIVIQIVPGLPLVSGKPGSDAGQYEGKQVKLALPEPRSVVLETARIQLLFN